MSENFNDLERFISNAVQEDVGDGDHTSLACVPQDEINEAMKDYLKSWNVQKRYKLDGTGTDSLEEIKEMLWIGWQISFEF